MAKTHKSRTAATIAVAVVVTLAVAGTGGYMLGHRSGEKAAIQGSEAVATVNDEKISQLDLYQRLVSGGGAQALDDMITEKLVHQAAKDANVTVTDEDLNAEISKIKENVGGEEQFQEALASQNLTEESLRHYVTLDLIATKVLSKDLKIDDTGMQAYFEENKSKFDTRQIHARHILVATEDEAKAIKAELDKGADFSALAKAKSTEPGAAESGGDLGFFGRGQMLAAFEDAAFNLKINEISAPVQTDYGWHLIQVLETKGDAPVFDAVKDKVKDTMVQEQVQGLMQSWLADLKDKAKITNTLAPKT